MGFGTEQGHRYWMVCLVFAFLVAAVHLTASRSSFLSKSSPGSWSSPEARVTTSVVRVNELEKAGNAKGPASPTRSVDLPPLSRGSWSSPEAQVTTAVVRINEVEKAEKAKGPASSTRSVDLPPLSRGSWSSPEAQVTTSAFRVNELEKAEKAKGPASPTRSADLPPLSRVQSAPERKEKESKHPRVAVCLVGGARSFELTGLSIKKNVLDVYNNSDIFLHVPLDDDAHKLTLLKGASRLAMARVFENGYVPESSEAQEVLTAVNSPNGIQGLLQYFRLVEGCLTMISAFEIKHKFKYDWIIRTRVDGYWSGPLPALAKFNPIYYHVPYGSRYGGLNDRFGIGTRNTSWPALSRLSLIPKLYLQGYRGLNSEAAFKYQLQCSDVKVKFVDFPFCVLTARKYAWPFNRWGVPVASIKSKGALNGAKCKPCHPVVSGQAASEAVEELDPSWGWIRPVKDLQLCNSRNDAEPGWESMFDEVSGPQLAHVRQRLENRTVDECIQEVKQFGQLWEVWDAPIPEKLCRRHLEPDKIVNGTQPVRQY